MGKKVGGAVLLVWGILVLAKGITGSAPAQVSAYNQGYQAGRAVGTVFGVILIIGGLTVLLRKNP